MARGRAKQGTATSDNGVDTHPQLAPVGDRDDAPTRGGRVRPVKRARLGVMVLTVLVTELVLIAAGANQGVSKHFASYSSDHPSSLLGHFARALLVFRWRVSASGHTDLWHTELITVGLVLLLGIVLVPMVVHGPVSWLAAFLGVWFTITVSVVVSAVAAVVLADLEESRDLAMYVVPGTPSSGLSFSNKLTGAVFGPLVSYAFVAGLALGLVVALITATVVASSRRTDPVPVAAAADPEYASSPETPQPFFGSEDDDRSGRSGRTGTARYADSSQYADSHPYAAPDRRASDETTTLPAVGEGERRSGYDRDPDPDTTREASPSESTTALPRVGTDRPPSGAGTTSELPRTEAVPTQASDATQAPEPTQPAESTQAWPAHSESTTSEHPSSTPDSERTAAFPLPPDDQDLGHHPDRQDD